MIETTEPKMEPVLPGDTPERALLHQQLSATAVFGGIELDHRQNTEIVENGRNGRDRKPVEVRNLEEFGDQKCGGAQNGRRADGSQTTSGH